VDVTAKGKAIITFVQDLHKQLSLAMEERNWTKPALINWIDWALPLAARRDVTKVSSTLFISKALDLVMSRLDMTLEAVARAKFRLADVRWLDTGSLSSWQTQLCGERAILVLTMIRLYGARWA
jgi:type III restriction enzyme